MTSAAELAEDIERALPHLKSGSLSVFGSIFGGRIDNVHVVTGAHVGDEPNHVVIEFDGGETLELWDPLDWSVGADEFRIRRASRVRWEWFYYGRPPLPENRYFEEFVVAGRKIEARTDVDWHDRKFMTSLAEPAATLLGFE